MIDIQSQELELLIDSLEKEFDEKVDKDSDILFGAKAELRAWYTSGTPTSGTNDTSEVPYFQFSPSWSKWTNSKCQTSDGRQGRNKVHNGIDLFLPKGHEVVSMTSGLGAFYKKPGDPKPEWGKNVFLCIFRHEGVKYIAYYAHMDLRRPPQFKSKPSAGNPAIPVSAGEVIGYCGCEGNARGNFGCAGLYQPVGRSEAHVHVEVHVHNSDPLQIVDPERLFRMHLRYSNEYRIRRQDRVTGEWFDPKFSRSCVGKSTHYLE